MFGRARLPIGRRVFQKSMVNAAVMRDRKRLARRLVRRSLRKDVGRRDYHSVVGAVGTRMTQLFDPNLLARFATWHTMGQRLGGCVSFDQLPCLHSPRVSGKRLGGSGASPHQCFGSGVALRMKQSSALFGASPLMTITKTFVPYFKYPVVPL
jgi:hypothetical protein